MKEYKVVSLCRYSLLSLILLTQTGQPSPTLSQIDPEEAIIFPMTLPQEDQPIEASFINPAASARKELWSFST